MGWHAKTIVRKAFALLIAVLLTILFTKMKSGFGLLPDVVPA